MRAKLIRLIGTWREKASGHYCQTYNKGMAEGLEKAANDLQNLINTVGVEKFRSVKYRMVLDFDTPCKKCGKLETILITSGNERLPSFHFCSCEYPMFSLSQDEVGEVPSFARVTEGTLLGLSTATKRNGKETQQS